MIDIFSPTFCLVHKMIVLSSLDATSLTVVGYSSVDICVNMTLHEKPFMTCSLWLIFSHGKTKAFPGADCSDCGVIDYVSNIVF